MRSNSKDDYPLTKRLTDVQFNSLIKDETILLQIEWTRPASVKKVTGTKKAFDRKLPDPPPNYYACSSDIKKNIKSITAWWKIESSKQMEAKCIAYDSLPFGDKLEYTKNIQSLMEEQMIVIGRVTDNVHGIDSMIMNAKERLINDIPCEGNRVRSASDASLSSSDRPHELRRRTGNFHFPAARRQDSAIERARSRSVVTPRNTDDGRNSDSSDSDDELDISEQRGHVQGLLSRQSRERNESNISSNGNKIATTSNIASYLANRNGIAIAEKLSRFVISTPCGDELKLDCNDYFVVNFRNVKTTPKVGGNRFVHPLDEGKTKITFFCRSRGHLLRMFTAATKAMMAKENPDGHEDFVSESIVEYIVGNEDCHLKESLAQYRNRLLVDERGK